MPLEYCIACVVYSVHIILHDYFRRYHFNQNLESAGQGDFIALHSFQNSLSLDYLELRCNAV